VNSSISNFSSNSKDAIARESPIFILKTLLLTGLFVLFYSAMTQKISFTPFLAQSQFQENKYKVEDFLNRIDDPQISYSTVIVGSSLSALLKKEYFSGPMINLAFAGGSAVTGLELIKDANVRVKRVIIDATILRPADKELLSLMNNPIEKWRVLHLHFTNVDHQPVALFSNLIKKRFGVETKSEFVQKIFEQGIELQKDENGVIREENKLQFEKNLMVLKKSVEAVLSQGMDVYFLEMPIDSQVQVLPFIRFCTEELRSTFPERPHLHWIHSPELQTVDGMHLTTDSAKILAKQVSEHFPMLAAPQ